jgi:hypothetical protein
MVGNRKRSHTHFLLGAGRTQKKKKKHKTEVSTPLLFPQAFTTTNIVHTRKKREIHVI